MALSFTFRLVSYSLAATLLTRSQPHHVAPLLSPSPLFLSPPFLATRNFPPSPPIDRREFCSFGFPFLSRSSMIHTLTVVGPTFRVPVTSPFPPVPPLQTSTHSLPNSLSLTLTISLDSSPSFYTTSISTLAKSLNPIPSIPELQQLLSAFIDSSILLSSDTCVCANDNPIRSAEASEILALTPKDLSDIRIPNTHTNATAAPKRDWEAWATDVKPSAATRDTTVAPATPPASPAPPAATVPSSPSPPPSPPPSTPSSSAAEPAWSADFSFDAFPQAGPPTPTPPVPQQPLPPPPLHLLITEDYTQNYAAGALVSSTLTGLIKASTPAAQSNEHDKVSFAVMNVAEPTPNTRACVSAGGTGAEKRFEIPKLTTELTPVMKYTAGERPALIQLRHKAVFSGAGSGSVTRLSFQVSTNPCVSVVYGTLVLEVRVPVGAGTDGNPVESEPVGVMDVKRGVFVVKFENVEKGAKLVVRMQFGGDKEWSNEVQVKGVADGGWTGVEVKGAREVKKRGRVLIQHK